MPRRRSRKTLQQAFETMHPELAASLAELDALGLTEPILVDGQPGHRITPFGRSLTEEQAMRIVEAGWVPDMTFRH